MLEKHKKMDKKKGGRPKKEKGGNVTVYLDSETLKRVSDIAAKRGVTLYRLVSDAIKKI
jgi:ribosomal protein S25